MKMECDYLYGWIKEKPRQYGQLSPKMVNPRDIAGNTEDEEEEEEGEACSFPLTLHG